jgi:predicted lipid carrier protein YhbT
MEDPIQTFFEELAQRGYEPGLQSVTGSCRFDIAEKGSWLVTAHDGVLAVSQNAADADCVLCTGADDFEAIIRGEQSPLTVAMQGRMQGEGDIAIGLVMQRIFH